jgi:hypothetical protein
VHQGGEADEPNEYDAERTAVHGNRCISTGNGGTLQRWELKGCVKWWHQQEHGGVSEGTGAAVPLLQQGKRNKINGID